MPICECQNSGLVGQEKAQVEGGLAKKRYPNWDPRSDYYQLKYHRCIGFEQGYKG